MLAALNLVPMVQQDCSPGHLDEVAARLICDPMDASAPDIARRSASRLVAEFGPNLPALTERVLVEDGEPRRMRSYDLGTGIAVAGFLVSAAQFGWQIYRDLKSDREADGKRNVQVLVRRIRLSLTGPSDLTSQQRDRLLEVVAEEIVASCPPD
jgi:hypothetical protein